MKLLTFSYHLEQHGWARAGLAIDGRTFDLPHGYCTHPLADMARIAVRLARRTGLPRTQAIFDAEPGGHLASFLHRDPTQFELWSSNDVSRFDTAPKERLVREDIDSVHLALSVASTLHTLFTDHGLIGFARRWDRFSFPLRSYWDLRLLLDESPLIDDLLTGAAPTGPQGELAVLATQPSWAAARLDRRIALMPALDDDNFA